MADGVRPARFGEPDEPRADEHTSGDSGHGDVGQAPRWPTWPGPPDAVTDGLPSAPAPTAPPQRSGKGAAAVIGTAAAVAAAVASVVAATLSGAPTSVVPAQRPEAVIAPPVWSRVDPSLTSGLVVINGAAEADGIVMTADGLVATSYSRITGDSRPPTDGFRLWVEADGQESLAASIIRSEANSDIALLSAPGFNPSRVARPGTPVHVGDVLTLLDDQGGRHAVQGIGVSVTATNQACSRAGSKAHPTGFQFSLDTATAEPGAALVRADGTVVGMYFGGNDATHHCAIPIADVVKVMTKR